MTFPKDRWLAPRDRLLSSGQGHYLSSRVPRNALHAAFLRSPLAHAHVVRLDVRSAQERGLEGRVYTASDLFSVMDDIEVPGLSTGRLAYGALASETVRMVGDPVAVALADSRALAEDLVEVIDIEFEELPPVPPVCARLGATNAGEGPPLFADLSTNVVAEIALQNGNGTVPDRDVVRLEELLVFGKQSPAPLETRGVVSEWRDGRLTVHLSTQWPHAARDMIADIFRLEPSQVTVVVPDVGGSFGQKKLWREELAVIAVSLLVDRPVVWQEDRLESLQAGGHGRGDQIAIALTLDRAGRFLHLEAEIDYDFGAYPHFSYELDSWAKVAWKALPGAYDIPSVALSFRGHVTNTAQRCPYRGPLKGPLTVARESVIDAAARRFRADPFELRLQNLIRDEAFPRPSATGLWLGPSTPVACTARARTLAEKRASAMKATSDRGHWIGLGVATFVEQGPEFRTRWVDRHGGSRLVGGGEEVEVALRPDGGLVLRSGLLSHGQLHHTTLALVAHRELGVDVESVEVVQGNTSIVASGMGTNASRSAVVGGGATILACRSFASTVEEAAAAMFDRPSDDVRFSDGRIEIANGHQGQQYLELTLEEFARRYYATEDGADEATHHLLAASARYEAPPGVASTGTHVAVVTLDIEDLSVHVVAYWIVQDVGTILNKTAVIGQVIGGLAQGIGSTLREHVCYDGSGQLTTGSFMDYRMAKVDDVVEPVIDLSGTSNSDSEGGMRPAGEGATMGSMAAVFNAVNDALASAGADPVLSVPIEAEELYRRVVRRLR